MVGAAAGGGVLAMIVTVRQDADLGLSIVKPINEAVICPIAESQQNDAKTTAAIRAFCANLPTTVEGIAVQAVAVVDAINSTL